MATDRKSDYSNDFPLLKAQGLYASKILGDGKITLPFFKKKYIHILTNFFSGNCLFNALSDQIYGHQDKHNELRAFTVAEMRRNGGYYKQFLAVFPGGGTRRNEPRRKRKNAGSIPVESQIKAPSPEDIEDAFSRRLEHMAQGGTYADNMEIQAFADAFQKNVKVYRSDGSVTISPRERQDGERTTVHIAYVCFFIFRILDLVANLYQHNWEHYSSIRNVDGPHRGLPELHIKELSEAELEEQRIIAAQPRPITPALIDQVKATLPHIDIEVIRKALEDSRGDPHAASNKLLDAEDSSSTSSQSGSSFTSFTERDADSEDDEPRGPNKRRQRRSPVASVENGDHIKQYIPSHLSNSITADPSEVTDASNEQRILLPVRPSQTQRLQRLTLKVTKPSALEEKELHSDSDGEFVPGYGDDDENDAASEYSSGTSRSAFSARNSPSRSRSASKGVAKKAQRQVRSPSKRSIKPTQRSSSQASTTNIGAFTSQPTTISLNNSSAKKAIKV